MQVHIREPSLVTGLALPTQPQNRPLSVSYIPRPVSGTSRRATPASACKNVIWNGTRLSAPNNTVVGRDQDESKDILASNPGSPDAGSVLFHTGLPCSEPRKTMKRNITPLRLLKPIQPPLLQQQSLANLAYLSSGGEIPTSKSPQTTGFDRHHFPSGGSSNEQQILSKEYDSTHRNHSPSFEQPEIYQQRVINGGKSERVMRKKVVASEYSEPSGEISMYDLPSLNATIADSSQVAAKSSCSPPGFVSTLNQDSSSPVQDLEVRNVYEAKDLRYWTGRYLSACDSLRTSDCDRLMRRDETNKVLLINSSEFGSRYDYLEKSRPQRAIHCLRSFCKSKLAIKSLENFSTQLSQKQSSRCFSMFDRSKSEKALHSLAPISRSSHTSAASAFVNSSCVTNVDMVSGTSPSIKTFPSAPSRRSLIKSHTVRNFGQTPRCQKYTCVQTSNRATNEDEKHCSCFERELLRASAGEFFGKHKSSSQKAVRSRVSVYKADVNDSLSHCPTIYAKNNVTRKNQQPNPIFSRSSAQAITGRHNDCESEPISAHTNTSTFSLRSSPTKSSLDSISTTYEVLHEGRGKAKTSEAEKAASQNHGSGQLVKKIVDAGFREVRKMTKRVGSMGWGNPYEDSKTAS